MPDKVGVKPMSRQETSLFFQSDPPRTHSSMQYPRSGFLDQPPAIILVLLLSLLICMLAPLRAHAQEATWPGTVKVMTNSMGTEPVLMDIEPGGSTTYYVRLSEKPSVNGVDIGPEDEWFVMVHMNGVRYTDGRYKDLLITPSFYRSFNKNDWNTWKNFRVSRDSDDVWADRVNQDDSRATSVTFTH